jgi:toxin ParE1/3/4
VEAAVDFYMLEGSERVALGFIAALEKAYSHIARHPQSGSPRYASELNLPGLRAWTLSRYPHIVFYRETPDYVDVWRVLHGQRDIPIWLLDSE